MRPVLALLLALSVAACGSTSGGSLNSSYTSLECAPYARQRTGVQLYGDAASWWDQADGRYAKGSDPVPGGVLVFRRSGRLPYGHVAVVQSQQSAREITVDQANWVHHRVTIGEPVIDVSDANDWSQVRVWWDPAGAMGATTYPAYGFIAP
jgi:hypothetical protein